MAFEGKTTDLFKFSRDLQSEATPESGVFENHKARAQVNDNKDCMYTTFYIRLAKYCNIIHTFVVRHHL